MVVELLALGEKFFCAQRRLGLRASPGAGLVTGRVIANADEMRRAISRMAHQIVEQNGGVEGLLLVGLCTRGVPLAQRMQRAITAFEGCEVPCGQLDITLYRDDLFSGRILELHETALPADVNGAMVVLVDDVLYTGRTIRAALDAVMDFGRPRAIEVAVLVDRGHRELPVRANYVGKNLPTARDELVAVHMSEIDGRDEVVIMRPDERTPLHVLNSDSFARNG